MEIQKYTVVPCPNCDNIKIVKEKPETTTCGQCRKSFKFKSARKFYTTDSIEKARFVRGKVQARVRDMEDDFDNIIEDVLEYDPSEKSLAQKHMETILIFLNPPLILLVLNLILKLQNQLFQRETQYLNLSSTVLKEASPKINQNGCLNN